MVRLFIAQLPAVVNRGNRHPPCKPPPYDIENAQLQDDGCCAPGANGAIVAFALNTGDQMSAQKPLCDSCGKPLMLKRTCTSVTLHCPVCGAAYPLKKFIHLMDEAMEQQLAGLRCDRL
jgi:ribosomal protein L37AE/L43A